MWSKYVKGRNENTEGEKKTAWIKTERESREVLSVSYSNSPGPQVQLSHSVFPLFLVPPWDGKAGRETLVEALTPRDDRVKEMN